MPTIVLADDHHIVRQGFRALLDSVPDFTVLGEAGNGLTAIDLVEKLQPQILIVDLMLPGLNGLEVINQTRHRSPKTHVIVLSMPHLDPRGSPAFDVVQRGIAEARQVPFGSVYQAAFDAPKQRLRVGVCLAQD